MFNLGSTVPSHNYNPRVTFLNSVFLLAGIVATGMSFFRWQTSPLMGMIDIAFALCNFALVFYLRHHKEKVAILCTVALLLSYSLFTALYLLAPNNTTRISLFFLLVASAFFLKGRQIGFAWLIVTLLTIVAGHFLPFDTAYSHLDIVTTCLYLLALYFVLSNYEIFNDKVNEYKHEMKALHLSEERFRALVENGHDLIAIISETGIVRFVSPSIESILGISPAEIINKHVTDLIHSDDAPKASEALANTQAHSVGEQVKKFEFRMKHKDGSYRDIEIASRNLLHNPVIRGIVLTGHDITAGNRAAIEINRSRQQLDADRLLFQAILDNAPIGIWMSGIDGRLKFVNNTFCNAVGISEQQFLSAGQYTDVLPQTIADNCAASDRECYAQSTPHLSTELLPFVDGKNHLVEITKVKLYNTSGNVIGLIGLSADITERKQAEERLRLTSKVFENTLEGITITDKHGNILEVNTAFSKITGYSHEELIGQNPRIDRKSVV